LHGRVNSDEEKDVAESLVRGVDGVEDLISELVVIPPIEGWYPV
jgi:osmotically-inducible protein OsmY